MSVQAGASLDGENLTLTAIGVTGVQVRDEGSSRKLTQCNLHNFSTSNEGRVWGVHVYASSTAELCSVSISSSQMWAGVEVSTSASATLTDCNESHSTGPCVFFSEDGTGLLERCTMSDSQDEGLFLFVDCSVEATDCHLCVILKMAALLRGEVAASSLSHAPALAMGERGTAYARML